jgi:hypothetical protein
VPIGSLAACAFDENEPPIGLQALENIDFAVNFADLDALARPAVDVRRRAPTAPVAPVALPAVYSTVKVV